MICSDLFAAAEASEAEAAEVTLQVKGAGPGGGAKLILRCVLAEEKVAVNKNNWV